MPNCPDHSRPLTATASGRECPFCHGRFVTRAELEALAPGANARLVVESREDASVFARTRSCPDCAAVMTPLRIQKLEAWLEVCPQCDGLWVEPADTRTLEMLARRESAQAAWQTFSPDERKEIASALATEVKPDDGITTDLSASEAVLAVAGMPVLHRLEGTQFPFVTLASAIVITVVFLLSQLLDGLSFEALAWKPSDGVSATLLTAMVAHGGVLHWLGNLIFLVVFGHAVELKVPHLRVAAVLLLGGVITTVCEGLVVSPDMLIGGASGAISVLMGIAVTVQPRARMKIFLLRRVPISVPLWTTVLSEIGFQAVMWQLHIPGIAWVAHLSGLVLGLLVGALVIAPSVLKKP